MPIILAAVGLFVATLLALSAPAQGLNKCGGVFVEFYAVKLSQNEMAGRLFKKAFHGEPQIYRPAQCGRNVYELAKLFSEQQVSLVNPEVLFFLSEYRMVTAIPMNTSLLPHSSRSAASHWDFHVVLISDQPGSSQKVVYDLDWRAEPAPLLDYLSSMFPDKNGQRYQNFTIRRLPLGSYMEILGRENSGTEILKRIGELRRPERQDFPSQRLAPYLESLLASGQL